MVFSHWVSLNPATHSVLSTPPDDEVVRHADSVGAPLLYSSARYRRSSEFSRNDAAADYGGLLTKDVPLTPDARAKLRQIAEAWKARQPRSASAQGKGLPGLAECLLNAIPDTARPARDDPQATLSAILESAEGQALGKLLEEGIEAFPTSTRVSDVLLSALLLDVDPTGSLTRKHLAGYSLRQQDNWGYPPAEIAKRFEAHLAVRFGKAQASLIAFHLLSVSAPEFLVKGLPATMVYGSHQWAAFSAAVSRLEVSQPGKARTKDYQEIMTLDQVAPVTEDDKRQQQLASLTAVIDFAIANGVILESADDAYSPEDMELAFNAIEAQHNTLTEAVKALATPIPTRRDLALAELRRVYGDDSEAFFESKLLADTVPGSAGRKAYSLLDIYMSGELGKHFWISSDPTFTTVKVNLGLAKLADIKKRFDEDFDAYTQGLKDASSAQFRYQLSLLPLEDRRLIEFGKVTTFSVMKPNANQGPVSPDHEIHSYINSGAVLIRAEKDGKVCHYLYSPNKGRIIKDADPTRPGLRFAGSRLYFSLPQPHSPDGKAPAVTILWQTVGSSSPKKDPVDFSAFSIYPNKSLEAERPGEHPEPPATFSSKRTAELAASVSAYYTRGMDEAKSAAAGSTEQERERQRSEAVHGFIYSLIPFYSAVQSFVNGKPAEGFLNVVLDVFGFVIPGLKGGALGVKQGIKVGMGKTLSFIKGFSSAAVTAINPLEGVFDVSRGVFQLGKSGYKKLRGLSQRTGRYDFPHRGDKEAIADGIYRPLGAESEAVPVLAVERNGKWYAFDRATDTPYGAPLPGFIRGTASGLTQQMKNWALSVTVEATTSLATALVQLKLNAHATGFEGGLRSGELQGAQPAPSEDALEPALRSRLQACAKAARELRRWLGELGVPRHSDDLDEADQPQEMIDQLYAQLTTLEYDTRETADSLEVFFKPAGPADNNPGHHDLGLADRVDAFEKRIAAIRKALTQIQAKLHGEVA